ncbi:hypothetical protein Mgra_00006248 [Meloidogyne graminicola]|uniref:Uncharacterized protein n=1 Tax=Meloidogyne graminicola TaxID=189291 RepID=A0A8S9ZLX0_9BILA|nr:hypothetical protein Mgra_00006248 [Meloidogyne graminicola]
MIIYTELEIVIKFAFSIWILGLEFIVEEAKNSIEYFAVNDVALLIAFRRKWPPYIRKEIVYAKKN